MSKITQQDIFSSFGSNIIDHGTRYFKESRVLSFKFQKDENKLVGKVKGNADTPYETSASIKISNKGGFIIHSNCSCKVGWNCKHGVAILLAYQANTPNYNIENNYQTWFETLQRQLTQKKRKSTNSVYKGYFRFSFDKASYNHLFKYINIEYGSLRFLKAEKQHSFSKKDLISVVENESWMDNFKWVDPEDITILQLLLTKEGRIAKLGKTAISTAHDQLALQKILQTERCFLENCDVPLRLGVEQQLHISWQVSASGPEFQQLTVALENSKDWLLIPTPTPFYLDKKSGEIGLISSEFDAYWILSLLQTPPLAKKQCEHFTQEVSLQFSQSTLPNPIDYPLNKIEDPLYVVFILSEKIIKNQPLFVARLCFYYGDLLLDPSVSDNPTRQDYILNNEIVTITRQIEEEKLALYEFDQLCLLDVNIYNPKNENSGQLLGVLLPESGGTQQFQWLSLLTAHKTRLEGLGWHFQIENKLNLQSENIKSLDIEIEEQGTWFNLGVSVQIDGIQIELLPLLLEWLNNNEDWHKNDFDILLAQANGRPLRIKRSSIQSILSILQELGKVNNEMLKLPKNQAILLTQLPETNNWVGGKNVRDLAEKLANFTGIKHIDPPKKLKATLRSYQQEGLNWLVFLNGYGFSGVLADDMGLGKTIQALAYLLYKKEQGLLNDPAIVICPTSLVSNWLNETNKFTPDLNVLVLHGTSRHEHFNNMASFDLIITTYPLVSRDIEILTLQPFSDFILDEAQKIKNPLSKMSKSIKKINAKQRLCLTGTPMENHLGELWSLFDFLMPGFLGTYSTFNRVYRKQIEAEDNRQMKQWLIKKTQPFLLRRTKDEVAKDLPPKTKIIHKIVLPNDQRTLYESIRLTMEEKVRYLLKEKGMALNRIVFLDALLKLRQVCCDPQLVKLKHANNTKSSAKLEFLMKIVPEMVEEGRRILIFSQFSTMLGIIGEALNSANINFVKLTGQTKNRSEIIDRFQAMEVPVFLISLKAGGVGLNLTAADTVIHYDPWWNPAVENQATDRAYRIGQDKPVFVYKLICEHTVEERVLELQASKQKLADNVYGKEIENEQLPANSDALLKLFESY
ncbi:MAG: DEAD/DEAH box helicase [Psychromonas sp.]|nr:DEAD/DEAH box helicase [Psychromonas sp.]